MTLNAAASPPRKAGSQVSKLPLNRLSIMRGKPVPIERYAKLSDHMRSMAHFKNLIDYFVYVSLEIIYRLPNRQSSSLR
jgi:hypothetical protein